MMTISHHPHWNSINQYLIVIMVFLIFPYSSQAENLTASEIKYVDGDTIVIADKIIRFQGIDAPEYSQTCKKNNKTWKCGVEVINRLKGFVGNKAVTCVGQTHDDFGRLLAQCWVADTSINEWMVSQGWAVAYIEFSKEFEQQEDSARASGVGIWQSEFSRPKDYRSSSWKTAVNNAPDPDCPIKGNINSKGVKIYHTPWGSNHYNRTKISTSKGEKWFCNEAQALAQGWRAPYR